MCSTKSGSWGEIPVFAGAVPQISTPAATLELILHPPLRLPKAEQFRTVSVKEHHSIVRAAEGYRSHVRGGDPLLGVLQHQPNLSCLRVVILAEWLAEWVKGANVTASTPSFAPCSLSFPAFSLSGATGFCWGSQLFSVGQAGVRLNFVQSLPSSSWQLIKLSEPSL